jgi:hypothetical protein
VLGIEYDNLRIIDDAGDPILFSSQAFDVVDPIVPSDWISTHDEDGERHASPPELSERCFFERWHDRDESVRAKLKSYVLAICSSEVNA